MVPKTVDELLFSTVPSLKVDTWLRSNGDGSTDLVLYSGTQPSVPGAQFLILGTDVTLEQGISGNIVVNPTTPKSFNENKDYLYLLPTQDLLLNPNLKQNPNW